MNKNYDLVCSFDDLVDSTRRAIIRHTINVKTELTYQFKKHTFDCLTIKHQYGVYGCAYMEYNRDLDYNPNRTCEF